MNDIVNFFVITVIFPILFLCGSSFAIGLFCSWLSCYINIAEMERLV